MGLRSMLIGGRKMTRLISVHSRPAAAALSVASRVSRYPVVGKLWRELLKEFLNTNRPELHHMRGRGSRWREKYDAASPYNGGTQAGALDVSKDFRIGAPGMSPPPRPGAHAADRLRSAALSFGVSPMNVVMNLAVVSAVSLLTLPATAAEGDHGEGHDTWHGSCYSSLTRPDTKTSCCNLADCRPTEIRSAGDHYEVMKDGRWIRVLPEKIVKVAPPDGGAHICAPPSTNPVWAPDEVFCIVTPFET